MLKIGLEQKKSDIEKGEVEFKNVNFGYIKDRTVLTNISFKVKPGEKIAILGAQAQVRHL